MCDPVSIITSVAGLALSAATAPKAPKAPVVAPQKAPPEQQRLKTAEVDQMRAQNAARGAGSGYSTNASTLLTGPSGIGDDELNLGKATLLGA